MNRTGCLKIFPALLLACWIVLGPAAARGQASSPAVPLTLQDCLQRALDHNPDLSVLDREKAVQELEKPLARSRFLPTLDVESSYTRYEEKQRVVPAHRNNQAGVYDEDHWLGELVLRLPIFQGGRRIAQYRIAELAAAGSSEQFVSGTQDLVLNVATLFYTILQTERVIESTKASIGALQVQKKTADLQVAVGRRAPVDAMKVDVRVASLEQLLHRLKADRRVLLARLARAMGEEPGGAAGLQLRGSLQADLKELPDLDAGRAEALRNRSERKRAELDLQTAEQALTVARADYWPQVNSFARYGTQSGWPYDQKSVAGALDHETSWAAGLSLDIPLFRGGATRAREAQAKLRIRQAKEKLRSVTLQVEEEVQSAFTQLNHNRVRIEVTRKNVLLARETYRIEQAKYEAGKVIINDVLDAQSSMLRAEVEDSQANTDYILAELAWRRALGEDFVRHFHLTPASSPIRKREKSVP